MSVPRLDRSEFAAFFRAVHGVDPFPWQLRLADLVTAEGWPPVLDVPTGAGKTAAIDIAVFHLALEAASGPDRRAPVRIVFVVDRRLVVDEAHRRASRLASALRAATDGVLRRVADRLRLLSETEPLVVARLRGGAPRDPEWVRTPAQPAVVTSTVDQVGSRLFFRGYGVSDSMKPVHAGLLGSDALLLLDEAHLSQPFVQTVRDSRRYQEDATWCDNAASAPFRVVSLSATPTESTGVADLVQEDDRSHRELGRRLRGSKPAELVLVKAGADEPTFAAAFVDRAWSASRLGGGPATVIGVVVNRVRRARQVFEGLGRLLQEAGHPVGDHLALLTGRSRPLERDRWLGGLLPRVAAGRQADGDERVLFVVATQCIEAGADLDFDALITEAAPLDCLRQRFGRLNRMGREIQPRAAILASESQVAARAEPDPVYGDAIAGTWRYLDRHATKQKGKNAASVIDFGVEASRRWVPEGDELLPLLAPRPSAPVLLPAHVDQWSCTSPVPATDPDVGLFLHGPESGPADVQIVWRADLEEADPGAWADRVAACPPSTLEAVSIPFGEALRWLRSRASADVADVEAGGAEIDPGLRGSRGTVRWVLRWRGPHEEATEPITAGDVRPGDLLVVPSTSGGCDEWGWWPASTAPVVDLGEEANRVHRGLDILRLAPALAAIDWREEVDEATAATRTEALKSLLRTLGDASAREVVDALSTSESVSARWKQWLDGEGSVRLFQRAGVPLALMRRVRQSERGGEATTETDESSSGLRAIQLPQHSAGVRDVALAFARKAGLAESVGEDVGLAAYLHDAGKAHPQFQLWLYGGDELAAAGPALAKSGRVSLERSARDRAGLPRGARHEVASIAFALAHPRLQDANDPDLVLWLVGTHHGHGRPFFPPVEWPPPGSTFDADLGDGRIVSAPALPLGELGAAWAELHAKLVRRYGPWGLARMEAILRLADHRRSEAEQHEAE